MAFQSSFTHSVNSQGSTEDRQLIARWRREIDAFLGTFGSGLLSHNYLLALELSANLGLGLTVMNAPSSHDPSIAVRARHCLPEPARSVAENAVAVNADCQASQLLLPGNCRYTLRLRNRTYPGFTGAKTPATTSPYPGLTVQSYYGCPQPPFPPEDIHSWLLSDDISFWLSPMHNPHMIERLRETLARLEARFRVPLVPHVAEFLEHYMLHDGIKWSPVHLGVVLRDVPADLAARLLSGLGLKHFRYLAPYRPYGSIALVLDRSDRVETCILIP